MLSVVVTPAQFFERRLTLAPNLMTAVLPPIVCLVLRAISNVIEADKILEALYEPVPTQKRSFAYRQDRQRM